MICFLLLSFLILCFIARVESFLAVRETDRCGGLVRKFGFDGSIVENRSLLTVGLCWQMRMGLQSSGELLGFTGRLLHLLGRLSIC